MLFVCWWPWRTPRRKWKEGQEFANVVICSESLGYCKHVLQPAKGVSVTQEKIHWSQERACEHSTGSCLLPMDGWTEKEAAMPRSPFGWCFISRFPGCKVVLPGRYPNAPLGEDQFFWNHPRRNHKRERLSNVSLCVFYESQDNDKGFFWHTIARNW